MTVKRSANPTLILIQRFLQTHGPASLAQISAEIGIDRRWSHEYMKILREQKLVYLAEYGKRKSNAPLMMYAAGNKPDAIKPPVKRMRQSRAESYAKHRDRVLQQRRVVRAEANGMHPKTIHYMKILGAI